jgi:hypothetical protein
MIALGKAALSDAAKEFVKSWLNDAIRVTRVIEKTASAFSTKLPGTKEALLLWVKTDAFHSAMELVAGGTLPEQIAAVDDFISVTGVGFGSASPDVVRDMMAAFYGGIREDLVSSKQGLVLVDNRLGQALRQMDEWRLSVAPPSHPGVVTKAQRVATDILAQVAQKQGWGAGLDFGTELYVNLEPPPPVENRAKRTATVESVRSTLQSKAWYAMYGGSSSGKTQLAILIGEAFAGPRVWIRLGVPPSAAALILETALTMLAARQPGQTTGQWYESACLSLGSSGVIVLDDLPRTMGDGALDEHVTGLCAACANTGVRLVTTSSDPAAGAIRAAVGWQMHEEFVPDFSDEDIRQLFRAHGAPEAFLSSTWFGFVQHRAARRHPLLLVEAARYLQARRWTTDDKTFDDLLQGTFASALDLPTVEWVKQTVPLDTTREFLYRLKVIGWPFGIEEIQLISGVPPAVLMPLEHLAAVVGRWVQRISGREYVISPLLSRLPEENLPSERRQAIHLALARGILNKRQLGPSQAAQALGHFVAGGDLDGAALVLLVAWHGMLGMSELRDPFALTAVWSGLPIPREIPLQRRIYLRALQVILRHRLGVDWQYERADLEDLLTEGESDESCQFAITGAGAVLATYLGDREPKLAIQLLRRSVKASRQVEASAEGGPELGLHEGLLTLLWMVAGWIRNEAQYLEWFAAVRELTPDAIRQWITIPFADQGSEIVGAGVWTRMADLPESERNWPGVQKRLEQLKVWAQSVGVPSLATSALRGQIIVAAEYQRDLTKAEAIALAGIETYRDSPKWKFLIADAVARQHHYFGDPADAIRWSDTALALREAVGPAAVVALLTIAGVAATRVNFDSARRYLEQGVAAAASDRVKALPRITVQGELGILLWNVGRSSEAYGLWCAAGQELITARKDTKEWKTLFRLFGNCTGYYLSGTRGVTVGDAEVTAPFSGILLRQVDGIDELYMPEQDWLLPVQMALLAESVGAFDEAVAWARRAVIGGGALGLGAGTLLSGILVADDLAQRRYDDVMRTTNLGGIDEADGTGGPELDDDVRAQRLARTAARLNLVALTVHLALTGLHDRGSAETLASRAAQLAREYAARHASRLWEGMAEVFDALPAGAASWRELWGKSAAAQQQGNSALQVAYGVAAIAAASPAAAVQIQFQVVPWVERLFSPTLYHETVAKFISEYWLWALDYFPMSFGMASRTRRAISEAQTFDDKTRVHAIIRAAAFSLGVQVPNGVQRWLDCSAQ